MGCRVSVCFNGDQDGVLNNKPKPRDEQHKIFKSALTTDTFNADEIDLSHFSLDGSVIGAGGFGCVKVCTKLSGKDKGRSYAMKIMRKETILARHSGPSTVMNELKTLVILKDNCFICNINYAFQDMNCLYLVLDYAEFCDMRVNLRRMPLKRFTESATKFYMCQIASALSSCHAHSILHRDVKPENIVMTASGYVKLTDFGVAKVLENVDDCRSTSGTHGYMAPEIYLPTHKHGRASDYFSLGITVFEFLTGKRPFETSKLTSFRENKLIEDKLQLASILKFAFISEESKSFLRAILHSEPELRLGSQNGIQDIQSHTWLKDFNWKNLWNLSMPPPSVPREVVSNDEKNRLKELARDYSLSASVTPITKECQELFANYEFRRRYYKSNVGEAPAIENRYNNNLAIDRYGNYNSLITGTNIDNRFYDLSKNKPNFKSPKKYNSLFAEPREKSLYGHLSRHSTERFESNEGMDSFPRNSENFDLKVETSRSQPISMPSYNQVFCQTFGLGTEHKDLWISNDPSYGNIKK